MEQPARQYLAIDLKSFYASVECVERGLDPLSTNLLVADESRTEKTICLAVSPSLKACGLGGRCRLFEAVQQVERVNADRLRSAPGHAFSGKSADANALAKDPTLAVDYIVAKPQMSRYLDVSAQIYGIYLQYVAPEDIFAYSVDEVFVDATAYLRTGKQTARELAMSMVQAVLRETGITATCGIGTNLYLAKIAMDIEAKHARADENGVRIAELTEISYRQQLWNHKPLTDFWRVGPGTAKRLAQHAIYTMGDLAQVSTYDQEWFYKTFGVDAEILIDHAWGIEPVGMEQIKAYQPTTNSLCEGQVLSEPYSYEKALMIVREMTDALAYQLMDKGLSTDLLTLDIGYDRENCDKGIYQGTPKTDHYGRAVPPPSHGSVRLDNPTNLSSRLQQAFSSVFTRIAEPAFTIRRLTLTAGHVVRDNGLLQMDLFTNPEQMEKEKSLQGAILSLQKKYGKNAVLKGTSYEEGATMRERNGQIGGHKA